MSYSPTQPEYYGWYPNTTVSAAFAQGVWNAIIDSQTYIEFDNTQTYTINCGSDADSIIVNGLFVIDKPRFQVRGNGSSLVFYFSSLGSSVTAVDGAPLFKWSLPTGVTEMAVGFENITLQLSPDSIQYIDETFNRYGKLRCVEIKGTDNTFNNVQFLDFANTGDEIAVRINNLNVSRSTYTNCLFRFGGSNHDNCLYIQGETQFHGCVFEVKRKYSSHALYWGLDRNDVVIKNCKFYYIGGYYPDYVYSVGEDRTGTVLSWRGTEGSGLDARGLQFIKNYIENSGRTLIGFDSGDYSEAIHRYAFISQNTWYNSEVVQFDNQWESNFTNNRLIGTPMSVNDCHDSNIYENPQIGYIVFYNTENVNFYSNTVDDSDLTYSIGLINNNNTNLNIYNNYFTFKYRVTQSPVVQTWQFEDMYNLLFENNRVEVVNSPITTASISFRTDMDGLTLNQNTFINCYLIFRTGQLTFTGTNYITNNTIVNNAMASSTRILENTASGPFVASGNSVSNGTFLGTLNNA